MNVLIGKPANFAPSDLDSKAVLIKIKDKDFNGLLSEHMGGRQPYRSQFNVAVDGSIYIMSAGKGLGSHEFTVFEGPFDCGDSFDCISSYYDKLRKTEDRVIRISYTNASSSSPVFLGVISALLSTKTVQSDGSIIMITKVEALGTWK